MVEYVPFDDRPFRLRMGLRPLDLADWLEPDEHEEAELALKRQLVSERYDDVVGIIDRPDVLAASEELWDLVSQAGSVPRNRGSDPDSGEQNEHPIVRCGLATQEDWVLMLPIDGRLVIAAACVCFPTRWVLRSKMGLPMGEVHQHVAFYPEHLERTVDSFFDRLSVDKPVWRLNWNLMDDPTLFQPVGTGVDHGVTAANAGERIWLRVERQTLRRLPESGAIVFSIRVHQRPISTLAATGDLATLRSAIAALPPETFDYKSLSGFSDALDAWIANQLETSR